MNANKKRKRDSDVPRITYHAENRTFDRLFKEESLKDTKEVVRRKLGLPSDAAIQLAQLREGKLIDLEDDDDFDAFYALAHSTPSVEVRVAVLKNAKSSFTPGHSGSEAVSQTTSMRMSPPSQSQRDSVFSPVQSSIAGNSARRSMEPQTTSLNGNPKRKNSFVDFSSAEAAEVFLTSGPKRKKQKNNLGNIADATALRSNSLSRSSAAPSTEHEPPRVQQTDQADKRSKSKTVETNSEVPPQKRQKNYLAFGSVESIDPSDIDETTPSPNSKTKGHVRGTEGSSISLLSDSADHVSSRERSVGASHSDPEAVTLAANQRKSSRKEPASVPEPATKNSLVSGRSGDGCEQQKKTRKSNPYGVAGHNSSLTVLDTSYSHHPPNDTSKDDLNQRVKKPSKSMVNQSAMPHSHFIPDKYRSSLTIPMHAKKLRRSSVADESSDSDSDSSAPSVDLDNGVDKVAKKNQFAGEDPVDEQPVSKPSVSEDHLNTVIPGGRKEHICTGVRAQPLGQEAQPIVASTSATPSDTVSKRLSKNVSILNRAGDTDNGTSRNSGRKKVGEVTIDANSHEANEAPSKAKNAKGNRRTSTLNEVEAAAADVRAAMSRVLAARAFSVDISLSNTETREQRGSGSEDNRGVIKRKARKSPFEAHNSQQGEPFSEDVQSPDTPPSSKPQHHTKSPGSVQLKRKPSEIPCPVCRRPPLHLRYRCPVIMGGLESIEKRLHELREEGSEHSSEIIGELEEMVNKGRKRSSTNGQKPNVNLDCTPLDTLSSRGVPQMSSDTFDGELGVSSFEPARTTTASADRRPPPRKVRSGDDDSSSESSSSDTDSNHEDSGIETSFKDTSGIKPKVTGLSSYDTIDLDALIRGPVSSRLTLNDVLSAQVSDGDQASEEVVLEEDDDRNFYRRSRKLERAGSSSEEDHEIGGEVESGYSAPLTPQEPLNVTDALSMDAPYHTSFQTVDGLGESVEVDKTGDAAFSDALAADTAIFNLATKRGDNDTKATSSVEDGNNTDVSVSQVTQAGAEELLVSTAPDDTEPTGPPRSPPAGPSVQELDRDAPPILESLVRSPKAAVVDPESPPVRDAPHPASHNPPQTEVPLETDRLSHLKVDRNDLEQDPIEPADDLIAPSPNPSLIEVAELHEMRDMSLAPSQSTPNVGMVRRMKNRSGKVPPNDIHPVLATPVEERENPTELDGTPEENPTNHRISRRTRTATRNLSLDAIPSPAPQAKRARRPNKTAAEKEQEAAAKEEKARVREAKALAKATTKRASALTRKASAATKKPNSKAVSVPAEAPVTSLSHPTPSLPPKTPLPTSSRALPSSLGTWVTLDRSSPQFDSSVMIDELQTSSPGPSLAIASEEEPAETAIPKKSQDSQPVDNGYSEPDPAQPADPLFILTESQPAFPYSQWNTLANSEENQLPDPRVFSPNETDDEDEVESTVKPVLRNQNPGQSSAGPYRTLTDIASQQTLFSTPTLLRPAYFPSAKTELKDMYGKNNHDDEEEEESDSGTDSDTEMTSHIPESRRAGLAGRRKS